MLFNCLTMNIYITTLNEMASSINLRYIEPIFYETRSKCRVKTHFYFIKKRKCYYLMVKN